MNDTHLNFTIRERTLDGQLTPAQAAFIMYSVALEVTDSRTPWDEIKDRTLEDLVRANQDALVDDVFEATVSIQAADSLLRTDRAAEILALLAEDDDDDIQAVRDDALLQAAREGQALGQPVDVRKV